MELTKHFTLEELNKEGLPLSTVEILNLKFMALILEQVRSVYNRPIIVTSGIRSPKHNAEVGGVPNSWHLTGNAVDISLSGYSAAERAKMILRAKDLLKSINSKVIYYPTRNFLHIQAK